MACTLHPEFPRCRKRRRESQSVLPTRPLPTHTFLSIYTWSTYQLSFIHLLYQPRGREWSSSFWGGRGGGSLERSKAASEPWESTRFRHSSNERQPSPHVLDSIPQEMESCAFGELQHLIGEKPVYISDYTTRDSFIPYFVADFSENGVTWAKDKTTKAWSLFTN